MTRSFDYVVVGYGQTIFHPSGTAKMGIAGGRR